MQEELRLVANESVSHHLVNAVSHPSIYSIDKHTIYEERGKINPPLTIIIFQTSRIIRVKWLGWCIRKVIGNLTRKIGSLYSIYCLSHLLWFIMHTKGRYPNYKVRNYIKTNISIPSKLLLIIIQLGCISEALLHKRVFWNLERRIVSSASLSLSTARKYGQSGIEERER